MMVICERASTNVMPLRLHPIPPSPLHPAVPTGTPPITLFRNVCMAGLALSALASSLLPRGALD